MSSSMEVTVQCPKCAKTLKKSLRDLRDKSEFSCTCGQSISVKGRGFTDAQNALDDFKKSVSKLSTKITLKI